MLEPRQAGVLAWIAVCVLSVFIGWMSGYDFDHRNMDTGLWCGVTLVVAAFAALIAYETAELKLRYGGEDR